MRGVHAPNTYRLLADQHNGKGLDRPCAGSKFLSDKMKLLSVCRKKFGDLKRQTTDDGACPSSIADALRVIGIPQAEIHEFRDILIFVPLAAMLSTRSRKKKASKRKSEASKKKK